MTANFTSGWLGNGEVAWHGEGVVTEGTLPAREAFETAEALFTVEKRELFYPVYDVEEQFEDNDPIFKSESQQQSGSYAVVRTDTQQLLGVVSRQYEIVQNESLLRMAEFIREEVDMDAVVVLAQGSKVCFTATIRGAATDIVPGDTVKRRIVGYLGHDGKTGCGAKFTNVRVVCQNTLTAALRYGGAHSTITHKKGANENFDQLIKSIDIARQDFVTETDLMREFTQVPMSLNGFREYCDEVYNIEEDQVFRKREALDRAFMSGYGSDFAKDTMWTAFNAITQIETSTRNTSRSKGNAQFARGTFGVGASISKRAFKVAVELGGAA